MAIPAHLQSYTNHVFTEMMSLVSSQANRTQLHNVFAAAFMANNGTNQVCQRACEYALAFIHATMLNKQPVTQLTMTQAANFGAHTTLMENILSNSVIRGYAIEHQVQEACSSEIQNRIRDFSNLINNLFNAASQQYPQQYGQQQQYAPQQTFGVPMNTQMPVVANSNPGQNLMFSITNNAPVKSVLDTGNVLTNEAKEILDRANAKTMPTQAPVEQVSEYAMQAPVIVVIKDKELDTYFKGTDMDKKAHSLYFYDAVYEISKTTNDALECGIDLLKVVNQNSQDVTEDANPILTMTPIDGFSVGQIIKSARIKMVKSESVIYRAPFNRFRSIVGTTNTVDMIRKMTQVLDIEGIITEQRKLAQSVNNLASQPKLVRAVASSLNTLMAINNIYSEATISVFSRYTNLIRAVTNGYNLAEFVFSSDIGDLLEVVKRDLANAPDLYEDIIDKLTQSLTSCIMLTDEWPAARSEEEREGYFINSFCEPGVLTCVDFNSVEFGYKVTKDWSIVGGVSTTMLQRLIASAYKHFNMCDIQPHTHLIVTSDLRVYEYAVRFRNEYIIRDITDSVM